MYVVKCHGRIVAKANREHLSLLLPVFHRVDASESNYTLISPQGRVLLTGRVAALLSTSQMWTEIIAAERRHYDDTMARLNMLRVTQGA